MGDQLLAACVVGTMLIGIAGPASAQGFGRRTPREGACFYEGANYRGDYFCVEAGDEVASVPSELNDEISSIRIYGNAEVVAFEDVRFRGDKITVRDDVRDLDDRDFNDTLSSVRVLSRRSDRDSGDRGRDREVERPRQMAPRVDPDVIIRRAYEDILQRAPDAAGLRLYRSRIIDDRWTEQDVRQALRTSPEFREKTTMTPEKASEIVRRAYVNVLKREPDAGSKGYVDKVLREKWTQDDVERELRKSDEYRRKQQ